MPEREPYRPTHRERVVALAGVYGLSGETCQELLDEEEDEDDA